MSHIVESCPLTKLNDGLSRIHCVDEDAVLWLTSCGSWHATRRRNSFQVTRIWIFCRSGLKVLFTLPKFQFRGVYPQNLEEIVQTPKRHILVWFHVFWVVARINPWPVRKPDKKGINKNFFCYISHICPEALSGWICTKFGIGGPRGRNQLCRHFLLISSGVSILWGLKFACSQSLYCWASA